MKKIDSRTFAIPCLNGDIATLTLMLPDDSPDAGILPVIVKDVVIAISKLYPTRSLDRCIPKLAIHPSEEEEISKIFKEFIPENYQVLLAYATHGKQAVLSIIPDSRNQNSMSHEIIVKINKKVTSQESALFTRGMEGEIIETLNNHHT